LSLQRLRRRTEIGWLAPLLLLFASLLAGCSKPSDERSATVSGKVTLGGAPVAAGTVLFMTETGHAASAELAPDGAYTLRCRPDRFQVALTPPSPPDPLGSAANTPAPAAPNMPSIPRRYHDFGTSGLTLEVKAGNNTFDIALTR
jgi:hypothetical protein